MGPAEIILGVLAVAVGGGLGTLIKSLYDAKSIKAKLGPEIESLSLTNMNIVVGGQATHIGQLNATISRLSTENHDVETRYERLYRWAIDLVTRWHEYRQHEVPPPLPHDESPPTEK